MIIVEVINFFLRLNFFVQKKEWEEAFSPLPPVVPFYDRACFDKHKINYFRWTFLNGDSDILPGLKVILLQVIQWVINQFFLILKMEWFVFPVIFVMLLKNVNQNLEPNIIIGVKECYESFKKIRQTSDFILPGHDPNIKNGSSSFIPVID